MRKLSFNGGRRNSLASLVLAMLLFRAYVPVGFMPASGAAFSLELCPAALAMPAHHHHSDSHSHFEHCPFGSAPAAGPISQPPAFEPIRHFAVRAPQAFESLEFLTRLQRAHQPRGPPTLV